MVLHLYASFLHSILNFAFYLGSIRMVGNCPIFTLSSSLFRYMIGIVCHSLKLHKFVYVRSLFSHVARVDYYSTSTKFTPRKSFVCFHIVYSYFISFTTTFPSPIYWPAIASHHFFIVSFCHLFLSPTFRSLLFCSSSIILTTIITGKKCIFLVRSRFRIMSEIHLRNLYIVFRETLRLFYCFLNNFFSFLVVVAIVTIFIFLFYFFMSFQLKLDKLYASVAWHSHITHPHTTFVRHFVFFNFPCRVFTRLSLSISLSIFLSKNIRWHCYSYWYNLSFADAEKIIG